MHTPGPWTAIPGPFEDGDWWVVGPAWFYPTPEDCALEEADARLIAAAPEMLEALEREHPKSVHMGFGPIGRTETGSYTHGMIDYGKGCSTCALIAKARGESESAPNPEAEGASR